MPRFNRWQLKLLEDRALDAAAADFILSVDDVADILDVTPETVRNWTRRGRRGWFLTCQRVSSHPHSPRAFRIWDVKKFAERCGMHPNWDAIPPELWRIWAGQHPLDVS